MDLDNAGPNSTTAGTAAETTERTDTDGELIPPEQESLFPVTADHQPPEAEELPHNDGVISNSLPVALR